MPRLSPANANGSFQIDNQPVQRGTVKVIYTGTAIAIKDQWGGIWEAIPFHTITNGDTGAAFASMDELKAFVDANFYQP